MRPSVVPRHYHAFAVVLVGLAALAVFAQTWNDEFISLDDGQYLVRNPHIGETLSWANVRWALTDVSIANWHPVTMLSHVFMAAAFGLEPGPHHAANVALHAVNAGLLYAVLLRMTGAFWPSLVAALLFSVHPLRVESVAWVSERKGLLCALFVLVSLLAYERYTRRLSIPAYLAVFAGFALALLSKPAALALPFGLLLLDVWPLGRFGDPPAFTRRRVARLVAEKLPLVLVSIAFAVVTYFAQAGTGTVQSLESYPPGVRIANAMVSYAMYAANTLVPYHLTLFYPHPRGAVFNGPGLYIAAVVLVGVTAAAWHWRGRPWFLVGWLWFLGMLVPAIGLIQLADQARADRYTYVPQIGLLIVAAWGLDELRRRGEGSARLVHAGVSIAAVALATAAFVQTARWKDNYTLFTYAVERAPSSAQAHYHLGIAYVTRGDLDAAEQCFVNAIGREPPLYEALSNLGAIEMRRGNYAYASGLFAQALELRPNHPDLLVNQGIALLNQHRVPEALALADAALAVRPDFDRAVELRAACLKSQGAVPR